ncbi:GntR family transcriptional regulator [Labilithrix luteola]|uniref:GntR family transcriptional regulator n=1 Tax=Labilithrix luteola TaxID=1391654 RepID=UPI000A83C75E|nr:FCD domain-containing protein [Labilithrix luteola]
MAKPRRSARTTSSTEPNVSLTTSVLDRLRTDILNGLVEPGEKLRLEHLTSRYGSGRTPLREACSRLAAEGLVVASEQRGFRVAPISRDDLTDLTRTRQRIETLALRDAINYGDSAWEADVRSALDRLAAVTRAPSRPLPVAWENAHRALHLALLGACRSPWLLRIHGQLYDQTERYRRLSEAYAGSSRDVEGEHAALVHAALNRDAERACALLTEHIAKTAEVVLKGHPKLSPPPTCSTRMTRMSTKRRPRTQRP